MVVVNIPSPLCDCRADAALATVQAALDPAVFATVFATGQQMSLAEAFAIIMRSVDGHWHTMA